jgi:hemerythrin-like metal-binding protein
MNSVQNLAPAIRWTDRFRVGVEALDSDHLALVNLINEVCADLRCGRNEEAKVSFKALLQLAEEHFRREEEVLRDLPGYRQLAAHAVEHQTRLRQLSALDAALSGLDADTDRERIVTELVDWFVRQSIGHDAAIKGYFDESRPSQDPPAVSP